MDLKGFFNKMKSASPDKKSSNLIILVLAGVLLLILGSSFTSSKGTAENIKDSKGVTSESKYSSAYETAVKNELTNTLEQISGVGKVNVMIYFDSGEEQVPAYDINTSKTITDEKDTSGGERNTNQDTNGNKVVLSQDNGKSEPFIIKTYKPKVTGICIVAEGADNEITELTIKQAVINLFNISADKVNVYPKKK